MQVRPDPDSDVLLAQLVNQMRRFGMGERVLKTALAAGVSWQLAVWVPGNEHPYLAPVSAVLLMQLTIAQSIDLAIQRNIGVAIGICVAVAGFGVFGIHAWSIALVVLIALAGGIQLKLSQQGVQQVAVTALIVLLAGSVTNSFEYAGYRIADSIIGATVALGLELAGRAADLSGSGEQGDRTDVTGFGGGTGGPDRLAPNRDDGVVVRNSSTHGAGAGTFTCRSKRGVEPG